ncbi:MAG: DUF3179 domain-containing (seleno)protein [bacterium]|nr:DUF3179 domain-containing (seleno)protein [bacterium]
MRRLAALLAAVLALSACGSSDPAAEPTAAPVAPTPTEVVDATEVSEPTAVSAPASTSADSASPVATPAPIPALPTPQVITGGEGPTGDLARVTADWATDFSTRTIDLDELRIGIKVIPIRDRIPPIDNPEFAPASEAGWSDPEPGLLLVMGDTARFYPLAMLIVHEIVNDEIESRPVLVTYCPLCNSALVFDPVVDGQRLRFGTSGLLRNSDLVMWDDATESLWQQIGGEGLVGAYAGRRLDVIPSAIVPWGDFKTGYPDGVVLAPPGSPASRYGRNPYVQYTSRSAPFPGFFDSTILDDRYPALERTVGVTVNGHDKAYPFSVVQTNGAVNDTVAGVPVVVLWSPGTADALDSPVTAEGVDVGAALAFDRRVDGESLEFAPAGDGRFTDDRTGSTWNVLGQAVGGELTGARLEPVVHTNEFWFAWAAFHPNGEVFGP